MKRIDHLMGRIFLVLFLLITAGRLNAQHPNLRLGAHFDPIITWFSPRSSMIERDGARPGYNGGLTVESYFGPNYAFVTGLSISLLGGNLLYKQPVTLTPSGADPVQLPAGTTVAYNLNYLTFPMGIKLKSNQIGYFSYFAQLGFMPQVSIGSKASSTGNLLEKDNISHEISAFNISYYFGGGLEYNIGGQTAVTAGIFFNNGFADVLSSSQYKAALNYLTIRLGMMF
jgi:hypothetical protein